MRVELLLVRHGQTDWNLEGRYQGRSDVALNDAGRRQAKQLAEELSNRLIDAVYSSTLSRSMETARAIAYPHNLVVHPEPRLNEINQGEWEGMVVGDIEMRYPELFIQWGRDARAVRPPGGESVREVHDRVIEAVEEIARRHPGDTVCVVTHKMAIVVIRSHYLGLNLCQEMDNMPGNATWQSLEVPSRSRVDPAPGGDCCSAVEVLEGERTSQADGLE